MQFKKQTVRSLVAKFRAGETTPSKVLEETIERCERIKHLNYFTY